MYLYHRKSAHKPWKLADSFAVTVGRTGLAWDAYTKIPHSSGLENKKKATGNHLQVCLSSVPSLVIIRLKSEDALAAG